VPLDRHERPSIARRQDALLDRRLEGVIMRHDDPVRIARSNVEFFGYWLAGQPHLHRTVVDGICDAPNVGRRIGGISPSTDIGKVDRRAGFEISVKNVHASTELS
jgi:hypothetical protein